jgi:outer membrane protein assembly factor BamB
LRLTGGGLRHKPIATASPLRYNRGVDGLTVAAVLVWSFKAGASADAPPLVAGDRVYYAAADKNVYALRLDDGEKLWSRRFKAPLPASPVLEGDLIYQYVPYPEGRVYGLRPADGKKVWRAAAGPGVVYPAAGAGVVAVGEAAAAVFYDGLSGEEVGRVRLEEDVVGAAYGGGGLFLIWSGAGLVAAVRPSDDAPIWRERVASSGVYAAATSARVNVAAASGTFASYDFRTGEEIWRRELGEPLAGAPITVDDTLFVPGRRTLFACGAADGEVLWAAKPGGNLVGIAAYGRRALVACEDGRVLAATSEGTEELLRLEGYAATGPAVAGDLLLITDGKKRLSCFRLEQRPALSGGKK